MRILHVGKYYAPSHGGIETVLKNTAEGLVAAGHDVRVLCFSGNRTERRETLAGVAVHRAPIYGTLMSQPVCPGFRRMLQDDAAGVDLVHVHSPNPLAELAATKLPDHIRVVCSYHAEVTRQKLFLPAYRPVLRRFLHRCESIVVATEKHIDHSDVLRPLRSKCRVIPYGLDPDDFEPTPPASRFCDEHERRYGRFVLFIGRLVSYKGLRYLIDAARDLPDHQVVILGDGPLAPELRDRIEAHDLTRRVHLRGAIEDPDELLGFLHACRVVCLPSISTAEAFGVVLTEAMACGKPVVTSRLPSGVVHVNQHGVNGLHAEPADSASLREALHRVLTDDALASRLGMAGRRRFRDEFTTTGMIDAHLDLYGVGREAVQPHPEAHR